MSVSDLSLTDINHWLFFYFFHLWLFLDWFFLCFCPFLDWLFPYLTISLLTLSIFDYSLTDLTHLWLYLDRLYPSLTIPLGELFSVSACLCQRFLSSDISTLPTGPLVFLTFLCYLFISTYQVCSLAVFIISSPPPPSHTNSAHKHRFAWKSSI